MIITLKPGETIQIQMQGTDGEFAVEFAVDGLRVHADMSDEIGREGIIYEETWEISPEYKRIIADE